MNGAATGVVACGTTLKAEGAEKHSGRTREPRTPAGKWAGACRGTDIPLTKTVPPDRGLSARRRKRAFPLGVVVQRS